MRCPLLNTLFVFGRQAFAFSDDSSFFCPYFKRKEQMATEHVLEDKELGRLLVRVNVRARRLTFRTREDAIYVTVPPGTTIGEVKGCWPTPVTQMVEESASSESFLMTHCGASEIGRAHV